MIIIGSKFSVIPGRSEAQWKCDQLRTFPSLTFPIFTPTFLPTFDILVSQCVAKLSPHPLPCQYTLRHDGPAQWECYSNSNHNIDLHDCLSSGKDSPSSKLLFAKDIPLYRQLVGSFYQNIQAMPQVINVVLVCHENIFRYLDLINEKKYICFSCERVASIDLVLSFHNH